jgi:hypothetical protein
MSEIYPQKEGQKNPYYVEFDRSDRPNEFTIFRRHFMYSEEKLQELKKTHENSLLEMCNEVHPWNIFTAEYGPDGCVPDKEWVKWMVDCMNSKLEEDRLQESRRQAFLDSIK